jgi:hypothetical protein
MAVQPGSTTHACQLDGQDVHMQRAQRSTWAAHWFPLEPPDPPPPAPVLPPAPDVTVPPRGS